MRYDNEIWKDIKGYEGLYQVSNLGRVKSLYVHNGTNERILKQDTEKFGYKRVLLYKGKNHKKYKVHRLVAEAFIPKPMGKNIVNHKDEDKSNNVVSNLEWCTQKYNINYGTRTKRAINNPNYIKGVLKNKKRLSKKVYQYDIRNNLLKVWSSTKECDNSGYISSNVSRCCTGKLKTYKGYKWRYSDAL